MTEADILNEAYALKGMGVGGCYCDEDQGAGYTYSDEHGPCDKCYEQAKINLINKEKDKRKQFRQQE